VLLADGNVGVRRLNVHVDVEDFCDRLFHLHEPFLANVVHGVLVTVDDIANTISTIQMVLIRVSTAVSAVLI
jgi:hypothetical protein